jgi:hypothetical protein
MKVALWDVCVSLQPPSEEDVMLSCELHEL